MNSKNWDDGTPIDRGQSSRSHRKARAHQRDSAVCRQAGRVLTTELMDLPGVWVREITPAPDASRLSILLGCDPATLGETQSAVLARAAWLRRALAQSLSRRRAPELSFHFLPETPGQEVK